MKRLFIILTIVLTTMLPIYANASAPNERMNWGFKKGSNGEQAQAGGQLDSLLVKYGSFYKGPSDKKDIYLTFDNGYENGYTDKILDVLKKEKVPATFFVTGHYLASAPHLVQRMVKEGHIIGNHSYYHPDLTAVDDERVRRELKKVKDETASITKQKKMVYLRPPRGVFSERTMEIAKQEGYTHVFWSLAFVDWNIDQQRGWQYSYQNIMSQIHPGAILLLHTVSKDNADALGKAITDLKKQGYTFKSLNDFPREK